MGTYFPFLYLNYVPSTPPPPPTMNQLPVKIEIRYAVDLTSIFVSSAKIWSISAVLETGTVFGLKKGLCTLYNQRAQKQENSEEYKENSSSILWMGGSLKLYWIIKKWHATPVNNIQGKSHGWLGFAEFYRKGVRIQRSPQVSKL